jgi:hypothetical protein
MHSLAFGWGFEFFVLKLSYVLHDPGFFYFQTLYEFFDATVFFSIFQVIYRDQLAFFHLQREGWLDLVPKRLFAVQGSGFRVGHRPWGLGGLEISGGHSRGAVGPGSRATGAVQGLRFRV